MARYIEFKVPCRAEAFIGWLESAVDAELSKISSSLKKALVSAGILKVDQFGSPEDFYVRNYEEIERILEELDKYLIAVIEEESFFFALRECNTREDFESVMSFLNEVRMLYPIEG